MSQMMDHDDMNNEETTPQCEMISTCCGAPPLGLLEDDAFGKTNGVCSECKQTAIFEKDTSDEARC